MALFVQLDTNWPENGKVARVGIDGAGLHAVAMCLAKRGESDGWIDRFVLARYADADLVDRLIEHGLLEADGDRVRPSDWLSRNPSQSELAARRSEAGRRGNHAKYAHPGPFEDCPKCSQTVAVDNQSPLVDVANLANASQTDIANVANVATESESESESESSCERVASDDDGFDAFWEQYPKKEGKKRANTHWKNMTKRDRAAALEALPAHTRSWRQENRQLRYIKGPEVWLNGRHWEDEIKPAHRGGLRAVGAGGVEVENAT